MSNGIPETVKELYYWLDGQLKGIVDNMKTNKNDQECENSEIKEMIFTVKKELKKDLDDHKSSHWKFATLVITIVAVVVSVISIIIK